MQMMVTGDKWELYIPSELAYGDRGSPPKIGGGEVLIFQMEILSSTSFSIRLVCVVYVCAIVGALCVGYRSAGWIWVSSCRFSNILCCVARACRYY